MRSPRTRRTSSGLLQAQHRAEKARHACYRAYDALLEARETLDEVVERAFREKSFVPIDGLFARVEAAEDRFRRAMVGVRAAEDGLREVAKVRVLRDR